VLLATELVALIREHDRWPESDGEVLLAPLALGHLGQREIIIELLTGLPRASVATATELLTFIDRRELHGAGIGYVDAQLIAATKLTSDTTLWTDDRRLDGVASRLGCAFEPEGPDGAGP
jgi:predicted nucleic acid-binding protein